VRKTILRLLGGLALAATLATPAAAHPHILIDAKAKLIFDADGDLTAIHNSWTFDEAFSVWQIQGLDTNGDGITSSEEMQELADENMKGLADYNFYTSAGEGQQSLDFVAAGDQKFVFNDNRSTLDFTVKLKTPYRITKPIDIAIADPEYYVAISFKSAGDVTLEGAPKACGFQMIPPRDMSDDLAAKLFAIPADVTRLPPDLEAAMRGVQGSIRVNCDGLGPEAVRSPSALDAVNEVAAAKPSLPFGGPPKEPGFNLPNSGFLGWIRKMQEDFYVGLNGALGRLKSDWTAFWVLGGLSFLYGVFHAAGPGHGKVVIGSYMLATERQLRRGLVLSFAAAMVQSGVAIVFVGIAAAVLGLSSAVMGNAVQWLETASYGLIVLLGLWLIAKRIFGFGHHHHGHEQKPDLASKAHRHLHDETNVLAAERTPFRFQAPLKPQDERRFSTDAHGRNYGDAHFGHNHGTDADHEHHDHSHHDHDHHDHKHIITPDETRGDWRDQLAVVLSVGIRPCSGALVVLVFALSQGVLAAGIAAVLLMGLGTALTVSALATLAVGAKGLAQRLGNAGNPALGRALWGAELLGGVIVLLFGLVMLYATFP
jgi:nickel/cobalt exporter